MAKDDSYLFHQSELSHAIAELIGGKFARGASVADIAREEGIAESGVEWWLAIARLPGPSFAEMFRPKRPSAILKYAPLGGDG
jgi:hypothetical protein